MGVFEVGEMREKGVRGGGFGGLKGAGFKWFVVACRRTGSSI